MILEKITSECLHTDYPAMSVIKTYCLEDTSAAIYPCYYMKHENHFLVSTSVVSLIKQVNTFVVNQNFKPTNFFVNDYSSNNMLIKFSNLIPRKTKKKVREILARKFHLYVFEKMWYERWDSIDIRIKRLKAFQKISLDGEYSILTPDCSMRNLETIIEKAAFHLTDYINQIEKKFPEYKNIILVGGKDSQLIVLVPKINKKNWIFFSSMPDNYLVKEWIKKNDIEISELIFHDGQNEETNEETIRKIIYSDLYSNPKHIRFLPTLKKIAERFAQKCIFWAGTAAGPIFSYRQNYPYEKPEKYFNYQFTRGGLFLGSYHQVFKNFVDCPLLSPYHSLQIWEDLIGHLDPRIIKKGMDLRMEIGKKLSGRSIRWNEINPYIAPYKYENKIDTYNLYLNHIRDSLQLSESSAKFLA